MANVRRISQVIFILLFFYLLVQTQYQGRDEIGYPVRLFLDIDPLFSGLLLLSAYALKPILLLSLITVVVSLVLGRFFCGWVCPFGTLHNAARELSRRPKKLEHGLYARSQVWKYAVLVGVVVSAFFSMSVVGVMDPLSLTVRSISLGIGPSLELIARSFFDGVYTHAPGWVSAVTEPVYRVLKDYVLAFNQPHFLQAALVGFIFIGLLALNAAKSRFWCRYVCPLGGLLGVISKPAVLRLEMIGQCDRCGKCTRSCPTGASPALGDGWRKAECIYCWNCVEACPTHALSFEFARPQKRDGRVDLSRRNFVWSLGAGLAAVPLMRISPSLPKPHPRLIRPPGSRPEKEFLERCVKCSECMRVCITNGLQPTLAEAGLEGMWSPMLVPRIGYCEYSCTLCEQVCPTGAIERLDLDTKRKTVIGLAFINKNRCLPHAMNVNCAVCEEQCPTPKKAIVFKDTEALDKSGKKFTLKLPYVVPELCIGCGICENKCPVMDEPAIYVTSINESRDPSRSLLLAPRSKS